MKHLKIQTSHSVLFWSQIKCLVIGLFILSTLPSVLYAKTQAPQPDWRFAFGIMQLTLPEYQGAKKYRILVVPDIEVNYKKLLFLNAYQGLGINAINNKYFTLGGSIRYNFGSSNKRSERYPGLKDMNDYVLAGIFARYKLGLLSVGLSTYRVVNQPKSGYYSPVIGFFLPLAKTFFLRFATSARYDDKSYLQGVFGINRMESINSGLPEYNTSAGWQNVSFTVSPIWSITKNWRLAGIFSVKRFLGQAARSPIVKSKVAYFSGVSVTYNFSY